MTLLNRHSVSRSGKPTENSVAVSDINLEVTQNPLIKVTRKFAPIDQPTAIPLDHAHIMNSILELHISAMIRHNRDHHEQPGQRRE